MQCDAMGHSRTRAGPGRMTLPVLLGEMRRLRRDDTRFGCRHASARAIAIGSESRPIREEARLRHAVSKRRCAVRGSRSEHAAAVQPSPAQPSPVQSSPVPVQMWQGGARQTVNQRIVSPKAPTELCRESALDRPCELRSSRVRATGRTYWRTD
jgi:hypothetical protein